MKMILKIISVLVIFVNVLSSQGGQSGKIKVMIFFEPFDISGWHSYVYLDLISRKQKRLDLRVYPFITKDDNGWRSTYGEAETKEVARIEAIIEKYPSKLNDYLKARFISMSLDGWMGSLIYAGINPLEFEDYVEKNKGSLLKRAYERMQRNKISNPGIYILGEYFNAFSGIIDAMDRINRFLSDGERFNLYSDELSKIKVPRFITLYDEETKPWIDNNIYASFKNIFGGIKEERIEFEKADDDVRKKIMALPAYLIEKTPNVVEYLSVAVKQQILDDIGSYYVYYDMKGMSKLLNREQVNNKIEIFIMSQCPFGVKAVESIIDYIEKGKIDKKNVEIHYIGDVIFKDGVYTFNSLHGDDEWKEDMRQIIISKYYPEKYLDYLKRRATNYTSPNWESVASDVGIDLEDLKRRIEDEGTKLLADDFIYTSSLKISVSPTFLVNGNIVAVGIMNLKKIKGYEDIKIDVSHSGGCSR